MNFHPQQDKILVCMLPLQAGRQAGSLLPVDFVYACTLYMCSVPLLCLILSFSRSFRVCLCIVSMFLATYSFPLVSFYYSVHFILCDAYGWHLYCVTRALTNRTSNECAKSHSRVHIAQRNGGI